TPGPARSSADTPPAPRLRRSSPRTPRRVACGRSWRALHELKVLERAVLYSLTHAGHPVFRHPDSGIPVDRLTDRVECPTPVNSHDRPINWPGNFGIKIIP